MPPARALPAARAPGQPVPPKVAPPSPPPAPAARPELAPGPVHPLAVVEPSAIVLENNGQRPWERLARESDHAWTLFLMFRDMAYPEGPMGRFAPRNLQPLAATVGLHPRTVESYSASFQWYARAGAFDRALDQAKIEADFSEARRSRLRHVRLLGKARLAIEGELDRWLARLAADPEHSSMDPRAIMAGLELIIKAERLVNGESTDHVKVDGEWNLEALALEDLEKLDQIRRRAKGTG